MSYFDTFLIGLAHLHHGKINTCHITVREKCALNGIFLMEQKIGLFLKNNNEHVNISNVDYSFSVI